MTQLGTRGRLSLLTLLGAPGALLLACSGEAVNNYYSTNYYSAGGAPAAVEGGKGGKIGRTPVVTGGEGGAFELPVSGAGGGAEAGAGGDSGIDSRYPDAPVANTTIANLPLDIFGTIGNRYWFAVSDEQLAFMNGGDEGGVCCFEQGLYTPGGSRANWVDHLFVTTAGKTPQTADYGKVQAKVVGQYSRFPWDANNIPNLNIDADEFVEGQRIAGYEHLRFSNGQRGSIFRDKLAYDLYRMLDYPAPLATWVWVASNVWRPDISIPYTLVERYKRSFCDRYSTEFGGGCPNMWEYAGADFNWGNMGGGKGGPIFDGPAGGSIFDNPENCQIGKCDSTRVKELEAKLLEAPAGEGFKGALIDYIDWPAFHRFQCLSWVLATGDDTFHNNNNSVLVERADGKFQYLPYSIDLSMGAYGLPGLRGNNVLANGCQADPSCWADTLDMCENVVNELTALDPRDYLNSLYDELDSHEMLRAGDEQNRLEIDRYFMDRLQVLPAELERYRAGDCDSPYVNCGGQCVIQWECSCTPDKGEVPGAGGGIAGPGAPIPAQGGAPAGVAGKAGIGGDIAMGGAAAIGGAIGVGGDGGGGGPIICTNVINYAVAR